LAYSSEPLQLEPAPAVHPKVEAGAHAAREIVYGGGVKGARCTVVDGQREHLI